MRTAERLTTGQQEIKTAEELGNRNLKKNSCQLTDYRLIVLVIFQAKNFERLLVPRS